MGKRKKASGGPKGPKKREPLSTTFQCLFCNHEKSVNVKLHKKEGIGQLDCRICGQSYQTSINYLSAAVDVYSDWIDACEAVAGQNDGERTTGVEKMAERRSFQPSARPRERAPHAGGGEEDDLDGFIENDEADDEQQYTVEDD